MHYRYYRLFFRADTASEQTSISIEPELKKYGIRVTGLYPGNMKTKMFEKMGIEKPMEDAIDPMEVAKTIEFMLSLDQTTVFPEIGIKHREG